jgi:Carboxypeptidase regulatory-like domain
MTSLRRLARLGVVCMALANVRALGAQADVIRGQVTSASAGNPPVANVTVTATSLSGNVNRTAKTDRDGRYTIAFPGGDGDYFVTFVAIGYAPRRFEVKRTADQDILIADARLFESGTRLDTVVTLAERTRNRPARRDSTPDVGGTERSISSGVVPPEQVGDLAAMAATLPGVLFVQGVNGDPSGFSVLGLDADQNATSLNGMIGGASELPRDASVSITVAMSPYDVSQGQFSGGRLNIRTAPGSNYITRTSSALFNTPQLEWTDRAGQLLGQRYTNANVGGVASGPIAFDKAFYNVSYQAGRRANGLQTLLNTDPLGLETWGIAADSVAHLLSVLRRDQVPPTVPGFPSDRLNDQGLLLGSVDFAPPSSPTAQTFNLTFNGFWNRSLPASPLTATLPATSFTSTSWTGSVQGHHSAYFGFGILSETGISVSGSHRYVTPYLALPGGNVLVHSDFPGGLSGLQSIQFGGTPVSSGTQSTSIDLANQLSWFSANNKHRLKITSELRRDSYSIDQSNNQLGTFAFNSLTDLQAGVPASFTRLLAPLRSGGPELVSGVSIGDSYRRTRDLQIVYGVRFDANRFEERPAFNAAVEQRFDRRNDRLPNRVYASPRIGFSWTYGTAPQVGAFEGAARMPRAVIRGGIGVFQNSLGAALPAQAIANTGLVSAQQQITCVGAAAPVPDWSRYATDPGSIPTQCADGTSGTVFASTAPNVTIFASDYASQRSLRSSLQWAGAMLDNRVMATATALYSLNMNQPGFVDLNFNPSARFTLPDEGRPVFVAPTSIVAATGAIASRDGRVSPEFHHVTELRSDLSSASRQVTLQLSPASVNSQYTWSASYSINNVRDHASGFASTAGNPFDVSAARSALDWRHQFQFAIGSNFFDLVRVSWLERFTSGMPYTPVVAGDVNGDGFANDRAFVADPSRTADTALASAMRTLVAGSPSSVRRCLQRQLGQLAARNSCEGPWTSSAFMSVSFNPVKVRLPQRATLSFTIGNPLGAADLMLHGEGRAHGWGQTAAPDPRLLFVRGFDAQSLRYRYEVNQRFGNASQAVSAVRTPVTITAWLRMDVGPSRERQGLTQMLDRGRKIPGAKLSEGTLKLVYGSAGIINPIAAILRQSDTLRLSPGQSDSIATWNRRYLVQVDSIWAPVFTYYAALPEIYDQDQVYDRYRRAREASVDLLMKAAPDITALLTAEQRRKLPDLIAAYLDLRYLAAIRSGTSGTPGGVFAPGGGVPGVAGGGRSG